MIANAYLLPIEQPPSLNDIKRALLSFDKIVVPSPDDRELIPPNIYQSIRTGMALPFGFPIGAVRPLGKVPTYNSEFQQVWESLAFARKQGTVEVRSAPKYTTQMTIGATPIPENIPPPNKTYGIYRALVANPTMVTAISRGLDDLPFLKAEELEELAPIGADDQDFQCHINGQATLSPYPQKSVYNGFVQEEAQRALLTRICHARLGTVAKSLLTCEKDELVPFTGDSGMAAAIQMLDAQKDRTVTNILENEPSDIELYKRLNWLQHVVVREFIDTETLEEMTVQQVLKLRTKAWGEANMARIELQNSLKLLALDTKDFDEFSARCRSEIKSYKKVQSALNHELMNFGIKTVSNIGMGVVKTVGLGAGGTILHKILAVGSPELALILGGLYYTFKIGGDELIQLRNYWKKKGEAEGSAGYALSRTYLPFFAQ